tara:strand:+ start:500 stop:664 length:165 start_codon:yes stop_codon:yes gene_type:complete
MEILNTVSNSDIKVLDPNTKKENIYGARIIVLDDDLNTFEYLANCLETIIPLDE